MAQYLTLLSVLLLAGVFNPIVCPSSQMHNERRDRAPYIESSEHSPQYVADTYGSPGGRLRKTPNHKDYNTNYRNQEQLTAPPPPPPPLTSVHNPPNTNADANNESLIDDRIRMVFATDFAPGVHIFNNTAPFYKPPYFNSYTDQMVGDQPVSHISSSSSDPSTSDKEFFKVQRSPDGKLSLVYKEDLLAQAEKELMKNFTTDNASVINNNGSNNETFENRFQTHFPTGLPLTKHTLDTQGSTATHNRRKDSVIHFPTEQPDPHWDNSKYDNIDSSDCANEKGTTFCTSLRNYPEKSYIDRLIKEKFANLEPFFGEDLVVPQNITQRMNTPVEELLCSTRHRIIYPEAAQDAELNWLLVVNTDQFKQGIEIEECINEGETCGESSGVTVPNRYKILCKQAYVYRALIGYRNGTLLKSQFKFPACCKCVLISG